MESKKYIPTGSHSVIAAINMKGAGIAIDWYKKVFMAKEIMRLTDSTGLVVHGEIELDGTVIMMAEENPLYNQSPKTLNGTSVIFSLYVPDVDATIKRAVEEGAILIAAASDQFYGDRTGRVEDPFGYKWMIATHIKDVSAEEMQVMING